MLLYPVTTYPLERSVALERSVYPEQFGIFGQNGAVVCRSPRHRIDWQCVYLLSFQNIILNFSTDFHIEESIPLLSSSASSQAGERLFGFLGILSTLSTPNRCVQPSLCMDFRALYTVSPCFSVISFSLSLPL